MKFPLLLLLFCFTLFTNAKAELSFSIQTKKAHLKTPISQHTIEDVQELLAEACQCKVNASSRQAKVVIHLPAIDSSKINAPTEFSKGKSFPYSHYPNHAYTWTSEKKKDQIHLTLSTDSYQGISCGLYGLLQEKLGFLFFHPKQNIIPKLQKWPLKDQFEWTATPRFDKKGFHLHTMHPTELTEALLDPDFPNALADVQEYIDWLARNQQNYFEFNLLETIKDKKWIRHARKIVDYGHERGIIMGLDISLHMIQQKAFMLYKNKPASFRSKKKQITKWIDWLFKADWDVLNVEFSTTEFSFGNEGKKEKLFLHLNDLITNKHNAKLMGRAHVVKREEQAIKRKSKVFEMDAAQKALDAHRGMLIHTVMCYTIFEEKAPVYQNENLRHMLDLLKEKQKERETWYFPESAYWITFDNSLPIFILPYLQARLDDILFTDSLNVSGHITFSSGWEWDYWLVDWSIARWSWEHKENGKLHQNKACEYLADIFPKQDQWLSQLQSMHDLQQQYLKDSSLMKYMTAQTVTDELKGRFRLQLHPIPPYPIKWLRYKADSAALRQINDEGVSLLHDFANASDKILSDMEHQAPMRLDSIPQLLYDELLASMKITTLRAWHRAYIFNHLLNKRYAELGKTEYLSRDLLEKAKLVRENAQILVQQQEQRYRYSIPYLTGKHKTHTSYHFGYLYPVSNLHFWKREELQVDKDRYGAWFKNIWNVRRIIF